MLAGFNTALQLFLPSWVRARGLSVYQMVFFGAQAVGAVVWGGLASVAGLPITFVVAAITIVAGAATYRLWPLHDIEGLDRTSVVYWQEPHLEITPDADDGPVVVLSTYTIAPEMVTEFFHLMKRVESSRLRTGATDWGIFRNTSHAYQYVEMFVVPSWDEHMRQHTDRPTGLDRTFDEEASALSRPPPHTAHFIKTSGSR